MDNESFFLACMVSFGGLMGWSQDEYSIVGGLTVGFAMGTILIGLYRLFGEITNNWDENK